MENTKHNRPPLTHFALDAHQRLVRSDLPAIAGLSEQHRVLGPWQPSGRSKPTSEQGVERIALLSRAFCHIDGDLHEIRAEDLSIGAEVCPSLWQLRVSAPIDPNDGTPFAVTDGTADRSAVPRRFS